MMKPGDMTITDLRPRTGAIDSIGLGERAEGRAVARGRVRVGFGRAQLDERFESDRPPRLSSRAADLRRDSG